MKKLLFISLLLLVLVDVIAQSKTTKPKGSPSQAQMDKMMDEATKDMTPEDKVEMKKMMKGVMPEMEKKHGPEVVSFTDNTQLIPKKDITRINGITKKNFTDADVSSNTGMLYNKLMAKIPAVEKSIVTSVTSRSKTGSNFMEASLISFMQGHNQAAMALAMRAVQAEPKNINYQNNLSAILSQSGYPENAIPYLKKLSSQHPTNSTVLHNLAYAWFSLGQIDTARRYFAYAAIRNPNNPETKICRGVIEELKGDPQKAADKYVESFEDAPNSFTEKLAKNVKADGKLEKIDFEKLKSRITIYEYFKKDWIKIPELIDNVSAYENNMRIKNGYSKMFAELKSKIEDMTEASNAEVDALVDKGVNEFAKTMMKESIKGVSMMSMPAVYVQKIIDAHIFKWTGDFVKEQSQLMQEIEARRIEMTKIGDNDKCPDFDRKNNEFLAYANPLIRKFYAKKIEESREWLNAFCTWTWYIVGNPKNSIMTQCIAWTGYITEICQGAVETQYAIAKSCVNQKSDGVTFTQVPVIPNFACPAVVSIPIGMDELQLSADAINFDNNDWNIKQAEGAKIPNVTLSIGADKNDITEPGKYGNPYVKSGNGEISPSGINSADANDEELTPLSKILDDLAPITKIPMDELTPLNPDFLKNQRSLDAADFKKIRNAELTRQLLGEMMKTKCPGELPVKKRKVKFVVGLGKLELDDVVEVGLGKLELYDWSDDLQAWVNEEGHPVYTKDWKELNLKPMTIGLGELQLEDVETGGLQTVINNGLEAVGRVKGFIEGLFK